MEFKDLPEDMHKIAAETLRGMLIINEDRCPKEPVTKLAHEVRDAFTTLYFPAESASALNDSD